MPEPADLSDDTQAEDTPTPEPQDTQPPSPRMTPRSRVAEWRARAREDWRFVIAGVSLIVGIVLVILGWYGAAYTNIITEQIPYLISGGLLGLGLIIFAGVLAASGAQKRDNDELRRDLTRALQALEAGGGVARAPLSPDTASHSRNGYQVFALPGGQSFHEAGCPIIEGKSGVTQLARSDASSSGLAPCKLCDPSD